MRDPLRPHELYPLVGDRNHSLVNDRIHDLYLVAAELRASRDAHAAGEAETANDAGRGGRGFVARTRSTVGRRLIAIGSAVAGQEPFRA
jgi:hypothetical protein